MQNLMLNVFLNITFVSICLAQTNPGQVTEKNLHALQGQNTLENMTELQAKNKYGQVQYTTAAVIMAQKAAIKYTHGSECAVSCPLGCCESAEGLVYEGGVFMFLNMQATLQAKNHEISARQACQTYNQISLHSKDCSKEVKSFDITKPQAQWFDSEGKCKSSAPVECQWMRGMPGGAVFGSRFATCKQQGQCDKDFYDSYLPASDGSLTIRFGSKTARLTLDSFKDAASLAAAGVPSHLVSALLSQFQQGQSSMNLNSSQTAQSVLAEQSQPVGSVVTAAGVTSEATDRHLPNSQRRELSSEGLTVTYNGEQIHISKSNLFEVISKRYDLNLETFIQP